MDYEGKGFKQGKVPRPCRKCHRLIQFLPTDKAPRGAWINADNGVHHRCKDKAYKSTIDPQEKEWVDHLKSIWDGEQEQWM